jgi:hypothetical protein
LIGELKDLRDFRISDHPILASTGERIRASNRHSTESTVQHRTRNLGIETSGRKPGQTSDIEVRLASLEIAEIEPETTLNLAKTTTNAEILYRLRIPLMEPYGLGMIEAWSEPCGLDMVDAWPESYEQWHVGVSANIGRGAATHITNGACNLEARLKPANGVNGLLTPA